MQREPWYAPSVEIVLDQLQTGGNLQLLDAVCNAIDVICDNGDSAEARRIQLITQKGNPVRKVAVRSSSEDWSILWWTDGNVAKIFFIGEI